MSDLIKREDVLEAMNKDQWYFIKPREQIERIKAIPTAEPNAGGWIPLHFDGMTSDYPYEMDGKWVLVTDGKNISVERIKKDAQDHFLPNGRWFELEDVIAWRPLPEPYEMERRANELNT